MTSTQQCMWNAMNRLMNACQTEFNKSSPNKEQIARWEKQINFLESRINH